MKYSLKIFFLFIILGIIFSMYYFSIRLDKIDKEHYISSALNIKEIDINYHYVYNGELIIKKRSTIIKNKRVEEDILEELKNSTENKSYSSIFDRNFSLLSIELYHETAYINLKIEKNGMILINDSEFPVYIWSLVNTITELDNIVDVQLLFNGEIIDKEFYGINLRNPIPRLEWLNSNGDYNKIEVSEKYMEYILNNRFDFAYSLLSNKSKSEISYNKFIIISNEFIDKLREYKFNKLLAKEINNEYIITYEYRDFDYKAAKLEWTVISENGFNKIDLINNEMKIENK